MREAGADSTLSRLVLCYSCDLPNTRFGITVYNILHLQAHVSSAIPWGGPQAREGTLQNCMYVGTIKKIFKTH